MGSKVAYGDKLMQPSSNKQDKAYIIFSGGMTYSPSANGVWEKPSLGVQVRRDPKFG